MTADHQTHQPVTNPAGRDPATHPRHRHTWLFRGVLAVLTLLALEGLVRTAARLGLVGIRSYPTSNAVVCTTFLGTLDPHFGIWHPPHATVRIATPQGDVLYETNAHGMRDRPRTQEAQAPERVVVLGDSFIEGCFVAASNRVTDLLEDWTGIEFLNFGTAGGFGSIQEWLLYEHLARPFAHSRVFLFLLPDNDFSDNARRPQGADRYQPYLQKSNGTYTVAYPFAFRPETDRPLRLTRGRQVRHGLYNRWYTLNVLMNLDFEKIRLLNASSYDRYTEEDLAQLLFSYEQLATAARPRSLTIYVIPRDRDFMACEDGRFQNRLPLALAAWAARQEHVQVVDLMPGFLAYMEKHRVPYQDFFLGFDPHWSPLGHRVAAELVLASQPDLAAAPESRR